MFACERGPGVEGDARQLGSPRTHGTAVWPPTAHPPQAVDGRKIKPRGTPVHPRPPISRLEPSRRRTPRFGRNKSNPQRTPPASPTLKSGVRGIGTGSGAHAQGFEFFVHLPSHPLFVVYVAAMLGTLPKTPFQLGSTSCSARSCKGSGFFTPRAKPLPQRCPSTTLTLARRR